VKVIDATPAVADDAVEPASSGEVLAPPGIRIKAPVATPAEPPAK
jgi:hypothetical protein